MQKCLVKSCAEVPGRELCGNACWRIVQKYLVESCVEVPGGEWLYSEAAGQAGETSRCVCVGPWACSCIVVAGICVSLMSSVGLYLAAVAGATATVAQTRRGEDTRMDAEWRTVVL